MQAMDLAVVPVKAHHRVALARVLHIGCGGGRKRARRAVGASTGDGEADSDGVLITAATRTAVTLDGGCHPACRKSCYAESDVAGAHVVVPRVLRQLVVPTDRIGDLSVVVYVCVTEGATCPGKRRDVPTNNALQCCWVVALVARDLCISGQKAAVGLYVWTRTNPGTVACAAGAVRCTPCPRVCGPVRFLNVQGPVIGRLCRVVGAEEEVDLPGLRMRCRRAHSGDVASCGVCEQKQ